ncbi:hypothetical protein [Paraburkholderia antibiotica]|uniref:Lipoprotein n=1 Tax=Paraburkholderia antibiotica TaxID=2728839 RepID=A0A7Y0A0I3_9BURK|nr:hypothetical protein [Paraburkholderia antibiotica]NML34239.1 hypothetical protein [Paraburkholderia antibiotica]
MSEDNFNAGKKIRFLFFSTLIGSLLTACASPISGLAANEKISPVIVYIESCNYDLNGTLSKYVSEAVYPSLAARRRQMPGLVDLCRETISHVGSALERSEITTVVNTVDDAIPAQTVRDQAAAKIGAKYIIFVRKPAINNLIQNTGPTILYIPYVYTTVDVYTVASEKPVGSGQVVSGKYASAEKGATVAARIAKTLNERCSNRQLGCGADGGIFLYGRK